LLISDEDHDKTRLGQEWSATVTDIRTGVVYRVAGADCGLQCMCDAVVVDAS
jgi:hypothetical protein